MREQSRRETSAAGGRRVYSVRAKRRRSWLGVLAAAVVAMVVAVRLGVRDPGGLAAAPPEIIGSWVTTDPRFADRGFTVAASDIELRLGDGAVARFPIRSILLDTAAVHNAYRITYERATDTETLELYVYADSTIRLRNPADVIWRRERQ